MHEMPYKDMMKPIGCGGTLITGLRGESGAAAVQSPNGGWHVERERHLALPYGGQLTGAFAYKCAFDLLYCWAEMPKSDVSDDMVMSSSTTTLRSLRDAANCGNVVHGRRQCRASNFRPWH